MATKHYWISWVQPTSDYRPRTDPPEDRVLGWWCTGKHGNGLPTLCALVVADIGSAAQNVVREFWPGVDVWRFFEERPLDWWPRQEWTDACDAWLAEGVKPSNTVAP